MLSCSSFKLGSSNMWRVVKHVFEQEFGRLLPIRMEDIDLHDDHGREAGWLDLFESHYPSRSRQ
ncbi:hypothetical protein LG200_13520 [Methylobacillus caricis]|uniref:hypothetical protein n=1 Tax=Methylobacillus caricis TaxID=1971611 RepID=UPI001CFF6DC0|nr:hypothetical protein [Methylobacillus caricis]MCB5189023.1 hypothetical protein [Methylobacillus caricis]